VCAVAARQGPIGAAIQRAGARGAGDSLIQRDQTMGAPMRTDASTDYVWLVQELYAAFRTGDVAALLTVISPDVEWGEPDNPFNPAGGTRHGHAGFVEWLRIGKQSEEILVLEPRQFLTNGDSVAVVGHMKCLAKPTGRIYESDFVHVVTFKDGTIARFQEFFDTYIAGQAFRRD
jgi:ketosteroid isomerase-like protein